MKTQYLIFAVILMVSCSESDSYIVVAGKAQVDIPIDYMFINIGLSDKSHDMKTAREKGVLRVKEILNTLQTIGVNDSDIVTTEYEVRKSYSYDRELSAEEKFSFEYSLLVTLRAILLYETVLEELSSIGEVSVTIKGFASYEIERYSEILYKKALSNARKKAQFLVERNGQKLGSIYKLLGYSYDIDTYFEDIDDTIEYFMQENSAKDKVFVTATRGKDIPENLESLLKRRSFSKSIELSIAYYIL